MSRSRKQCLSASPGLGWRCERRRNHTGQHRAAWARWAPEEGSIWTSKQEEMPSALDEANLFLPLNPEQELRTWWFNVASAEIDKTVPKAIEYGSTDLIDIGRNIARLADYPVDDQQAALLGVFFYLEGKFARWRSAIHEKRPVSDDTLLDIGVYVRMAQRIRAAGGWPGTKEETQ